MKQNDLNLIKNKEEYVKRCDEIRIEKIHRLKCKIEDIFFQFNDFVLIVGGSYATFTNSIYSDVDFLILSEKYQSIFNDKLINCDVFDNVVTKMFNNKSHLTFLELSSIIDLYKFDVIRSMIFFGNQILSNMSNTNELKKIFDQNLYSRQKFIRKYYSFTIDILKKNMNWKKNYSYVPIKHVLLKAKSVIDWNTIVDQVSKSNILAITDMIVVINRLRDYLKVCYEKSCLPSISSLDTFGRILSIENLKEQIFELDFTLDKTISAILTD